MPRSCAFFTAASKPRTWRAVLHLGQDQVGGGVENAAEAHESRGRQCLAEQGEDRRAAHHRRLKHAPRAHVVGRRQVAQLVIRINDRPLVPCYPKCTTA
jgi:methylase of polypeptide subunit release factors